MRFYIETQLVPYRNANVSTTFYLLLLRKTQCNIT